jgi:hypothetical protein
MNNNSNNRHNLKRKYSHSDSNINTDLYNNHFKFTSNCKQRIIKNIYKDIDFRYITYDDFERLKLITERNGLHFIYPSFTKSNINYSFNILKNILCGIVSTDNLNYLFYEYITNPEIRQIVDYYIKKTIDEKSVYILTECIPYIIKEGIFISEEKALKIIRDYFNNLNYKYGIFKYFDDTPLNIYDTNYLNTDHKIFIDLFIEKKVSYSIYNTIMSRILYYTNPNLVESSIKKVKKIKYLPN